MNAPGVCPAPCFVTSPPVVPVETICFGSFSLASQNILSGCPMFSPIHVDT